MGLRVLLRRVLCLCLGMGLSLRKGGRAGDQRGGGQQTQGGPQGRGAGARCHEVNLLNEGLKTEKSSIIQISNGNTIDFPKIKRGMSCIVLFDFQQYPG